MIKKEKKCRGVSYEEVVDGQAYFWLIKINKPFYNRNRWWFSLNDNFFKEARIRGADNFIVEVGDKEVFIPVLKEKDLEVKEWRQEVEIVPSKFPGSPPYKRYLFELDNYKPLKVAIEPKIKQLTLCQKI